MPTIPRDVKILCLTGYPKPLEAIVEGDKRGGHRRTLLMSESKQYWF